MMNVDNMETLDNTNDLFDYFADMDLNSDIKDIYDVINDEQFVGEFEKEKHLSELRNENHKRYYAINTKRIENLPDEFSEIVYDILKLYNFIDSKILLTEDISAAENSKMLLDNIYRKLGRTDKMVETTLKEIVAENDKNQSKFSTSYFKNLDIDIKTKESLLNKYNDLVLFNTLVIDDNYENLKRQIIRKDYISEILKLLNIEEEHKVNLRKKDKLPILNQKIDEEIKKHREKINYLEDLMPEGSKHTTEFNDFRDFCNKIMAYDDTDYDNAKQTYEILSDDSRFKILINNFEELFIQERLDIKKEQQFVFEKFGIKNIKTSLNYITENYIDMLTIDEKKVINEVTQESNSEKYNLIEMQDKLSIIVKNIWKNTITDVYEYDSNDDFYFMCSSSQFIDEKHQAILISKNELNIVNDYSNYELGFICGYNDNILYITENDDIMSVNYNDMSNLKTPIQVEQEFINSKVCNRLALNGYKTKVEAVYYISDNDANKDYIKYKKAVELANTYKLPLIELKKNNKTIDE